MLRLATLPLITILLLFPCVASSEDPSLAPNANLTVSSNESTMPPEESHRRGDEGALQAQLESHVKTTSNERELKRIAYRRKVHEEHIKAHRMVDPDINVEVTEEVRRKYIEARRKLLNGSGTPMSGMRSVLGVLVLTIPLVAFFLWQKT